MSHRTLKDLLCTAAITSIMVCFVSSIATAQNLSGNERSQVKDILKNVKAEIKGDYFDPAFKGVDLDTVFEDARKKLDTVTSLGQAFGIIGQAVLSLNDTHTTFYPPERNLKVDYGWRMQMIGDNCYVTAVRPKSDAENKGLKVGDEVLSIEGFRPNRKELWKINYYYNAISLRASLNIIVRSPDSTESRQLNIASRMVRQQTYTDYTELLRQLELGGDDKVENRFVQVGKTLAWKMPTFEIDPAVVDGIMTGRVSHADNLIIDLRGNGGGLVDTLEALAGYFVDHDTKIADVKGRKEMKPQTAKSKGKNIYRGRLVVLIDSNSASASEIFARFIQLQQKGVVLGDQSAGAVMMSRPVAMSLGTDTIIAYGMNMTVADVIMTDGVSLEHVGVSPNVRLLPTGPSISKLHDPVLAEAFDLLGEKVTTEQAGQFFPFKWPDLD
jgi:C-terminal processing protease CtpA/Prc